MNQNHSFHKFIEGLKGVTVPIAVYYVVRLIAHLLLAALAVSAVRSFGEGGNRLLTEQEGTINAIIGGFAMLIGILSLLPDFRRTVNKEKKEKEGNDSLLKITIVTLLLAITSSLAVNILFIELHITENSETYSKVAQKQYGVPFLLGIILYGLISPIAEEILFRGLVYNRLKKYCAVPAAILLSAVLFGLFHGNLVQGVYGFLMGCLMAIVYERFGSFLHAVLFHAVANVTVYTVTGMEGLYSLLVTPWICVILFGASVALLCWIWKKCKIEGSDDNSVEEGGKHR
ncbi:MAG: CPBP family intramembrane metalloprotease [Lachnospiraceae bacterium]|nr:CPBP family intramembrane metalloprotease [Lachnospiraceae bacterium]